jgi:hypothetical protein
MVVITRFQWWKIVKIQSQQTSKINLTTSDSKVVDVFKWNYKSLYITITIQTRSRRKRIIPILQEEVNKEENLVILEPQSSKPTN